MTNAKGWGGSLQPRGVVLAPHYHEEHASWLEWVGGEFEPEYFDVVDADRCVPKKRARRRYEDA